MVAASCSPTKIMVSKYSPRDSTDRPQGMVYLLPKKYLSLTITYDIYRKIKIKEYKNNIRPTEYTLEETYAGITQPIAVEEELLPDPQEAFVVRFQNKGSSSNNLNATFNFDMNGMVSSVNTESTGVGAELLSATFSTALGFARFGNPVTALSDIKIRGEIDAPEITYAITYAIDTARQTFKRLIEVVDRTQKINLRAREFVPEITTGGPIISITLDKNTQTPVINYKNTYFENPRREATGLVYRIAIPLRTTVEVKNDTDNKLLRTQNSFIAFDRPILYPQFGPYGIAPIDIKGGRYQQNSMEFHPVTGALKTYTSNKKSNKAENLRSLTKDLDNLKQNLQEMKEKKAENE